MADVGAVAGNLMESAGSFLAKVGAMLQQTHVPEQIKAVDVAGLFSNPWILIPFVAFVGYEVYKKAFRDLIIIGLLMGSWYLSGTQYMQTLVIGDQLQINKILPLLFGGAVVVGIIIYLLFVRSD